MFSHYSSGAVRTQLIERIGVTKEESDKFWDSYANKYPVGRAGEPEDMATAILYLSSDDSSFITGSCLVADGGHVAANAGWARIGQTKQDNIE